MRGERLRRVLVRPDEEILEAVPVLGRRLLDLRACPPAADQVDEPVEVPVPLGDPVRPPCVAAASRKSTDALSTSPLTLDASASSSSRRLPAIASAAPSAASRSTTVGPRFPAAPAIAITRSWSLAATGAPR